MTMNKGTGLIYKGTQPTYAFKRTVGNGTFITLEELFQLTGRQSGFSTPSIKFLEWFFHTKVSGLKNFELLIDQTDFNQDGSFKRDLVEKTDTKSIPAPRQPKSNQIVIEEEFSAEPTETAEAPNLEQSDNSGTVTVTSSEVQVTDSVQNATEALVEQAKAMAQQPDKRGFIVDNRPEKETKVEASTVITGDDFKQNSDEASRAVVLHAGKTPVGVDSVPENMKFANRVDSNAFVLEPPAAPASQDVMNDPVVNFGGSATALEKAKMESSAPQESIGKNTMSQPAMTASDNLKQPISLDTIVRNPSDASAIDAINKCRDWHMLKIASKQLRNLGNKPALEKAVEKRLGTIPPGSAG